MAWFAASRDARIFLATSDNDLLITLDLFIISIDTEPELPQTGLETANKAFLTSEIDLCEMKEDYEDVGLLPELIDTIPGGEKRGEKDVDTTRDNQSSVDNEDDGLQDRDDTYQPTGPKNQVYTGVGFQASISFSGPVHLCAVNSTVPFLEHCEVHKSDDGEKAITVTGLRRNLSLDDDGVGGKLGSLDVEEELEDYDVLTVTPLYMVPVLTDDMDHLMWCRERKFRRTIEEESYASFDMIPPSWDEISIVLQHTTLFHLDCGITLAEEQTPASSSVAEICNKGQETTLVGNLCHPHHLHQEEETAGDDLSNNCDAEEKAVVANQFLTLGIKLSVASIQQLLQLSNTINLIADTKINTNAEILANEEENLQFVRLYTFENVDKSTVTVELYTSKSEEQHIYGQSLVMEQLWMTPIDFSNHSVLCALLQECSLLEYELLSFEWCEELAENCVSCTGATDWGSVNQMETTVLVSSIVKTISCTIEHKGERTEKIERQSDEPTDLLCSTGSIGDCGETELCGWRGQKVNCSEEGRQLSLRPYSDDIYEIALIIFLHHTTIQVRNYSFSILRVSIMQDPKAEIVKNFKIRPREQVSSSRTDAFCSCHQPHSSAINNKLKNRSHNNNKHLNSTAKQSECFSARSACGPMQSTASEGNRWSSSGCLGEMKVALVTLHNTLHLNSTGETTHCDDGTDIKPAPVSERNCNDLDQCS